MSSTPGNNKILNGLVGSFEFDQCVEQINVLNLRLKNADDRANNLMADLRRVRQVCAEQHLSQHEHANKLPPPPPPLLLSSSQLLLNSNSPISESISLPPLITAPNCKGITSLARTVTQHLNITNGISFRRNSLIGEDSSGAVTPASSLRGGASSPTLPTSPSVSDAHMRKIKDFYCSLAPSSLYMYIFALSSNAHTAKNLQLIIVKYPSSNLSQCVI